MPRATLIHHEKVEMDDGSILEMILWEVPMPVRGSGHRFKYSLFYGEPGRRMVGYDNEAGKGDHRHYDGHEETYQFTTRQQLVRDFLADVSRIRAGAKRE